MLSTLKRDGICYTPWSMSLPEFVEMYKYLDQCQVSNTHVWAKADKFNHIKQVRNRPQSDGHIWPVFSPHMDSIVLAPFFFEYALRGFDIAQKYFGEFPRMYSMNCFWTQPGTYEYKDTHDWHRDADDKKQLVMFMYGTSVFDINDGAHKYQKGSHLDHDKSKCDMNPPENKVEIVKGKVGTIFFVDTWGCHMGIRPNKLRMLCWARWGVSAKPASYIWDKLQPVPKELLGERYPTDPQLQESIKLVVA